MRMEKMAYVKLLLNQFVIYKHVVWLGGAVVRALDVRLKGRGFKSQPLHCRVQL